MGIEATINHEEAKISRSLVRGVAYGIGAVTAGLLVQPYMSDTPIASISRGALATAICIPIESLLVKNKRQRLANIPSILAGNTMGWLTYQYLIQ